MAVFAIMSGWNTGFVAIVSGQDMCDVVISVSLRQRMVFNLVIQHLQWKYESNEPTLVPGNNFVNFHTFSGQSPTPVKN